MIDSSVEKLAESKLAILYLLDRMGIPMSKGQLSQFALETNYINYFSFQSYLSDLVEDKSLKEVEDYGKLVYVNTSDGKKLLELFIHRIPDDIKEKIDQYVEKTKSKVKREYEAKATYIHIGEDNYLITCGIYEEEKKLLEVKMTVATKEQAAVVMHNWKTKTDTLYFDIITELLEK